jgi:hypothetical protein
MTELLVVSELLYLTLRFGERGGARERLADGLAF